ncbi:MAG TPA: hypothetical protein EYP56_01660 [Planctomycetaceae bacterium]|nr:hypothetical protein [Planctomycetaceae bacterium]
MLSFRTFRNTDPPLLAALWRSRATQLGLTQPVSAEVLEQLVFAKPYFDYQGLILAFDAGRPVGFVHAGFGPNPARDGLETDTGVICVVVVSADCDQAAVGHGLLDRSEAYLRARGARVLYGGGQAPLEPFYVGLYGGSHLPGILDADSAAQQLFLQRGYQQVDRTMAVRCHLAGFRPPFHRSHHELRRKMTVSLRWDPPARNWWEACMAAYFDYLRFQLTPRHGQQPVAQATFRSMELYGANLNRAMAMVDVEVAANYCDRPAGVFLVGEAFRQLAVLGTQTVDAQALRSDRRSAALLEALGLTLVDQGAVFRKEFA